jgi:hypothetical protein
MVVSYRKHHTIKRSGLDELVGVESYATYTPYHLIMLPPKS